MNKPKSPCVQDCPNRTAPAKSAARRIRHTKKSFSNGGKNGRGRFGESKTIRRILCGFHNGEGGNQYDGAGNHGIWPADSGLVQQDVAICAHDAETAGK